MRRFRRISFSSCHELVEKKESENGAAKKRTALECSQYEDDLEDWLEEKGIRDREKAESFSDLGFSTEDLESIFQQTRVPRNLWKRFPGWKTWSAPKKIIHDLGEASTRISQLVTAIKSHVHMDQSNALQPTNIHEDIDNTVTLLGFKLREKNIELTKDYCKDMTLVPVYVGELNQVWTNLIDNAIFAVE